ncbi:aminoacyl-tRNA deacylase [Hahella ganghwensis]|uniref:aminoacyl-tRNA deacylase n=1 Tax=Hahella ganghwensis TaxID=286420 RepID=UPI0003789D67|nr:YbaK/EbsC family protein [Hahella ganghwensis]
MPVESLKNFLDAHQVRYVLTQHSPAYTAQEIAQSAHICGKMLAKTVIIMMDGKMSMTVMPATSRIRWDRLSRAMGTDFIELADEEEFQDAFPDCELGAMPPFGNLFGMSVYMDEELRNLDNIAFSAGSHSETLTMSMSDYVDLVKPIAITEGFVKPSATPPLQRHRLGRLQVHRHA